MAKTNTLVKVNEDYQEGYEYSRSEPEGKNFDPDFKPQLTPKQMFDLGIFGGNYFHKIPREFPSDWFSKVEFSKDGADKNLNYFKVNASQPLSVWKEKGWIYFEDPKGWFLWYCRYYMGRRILEEDKRQIRRWRAMHRHVSQLESNCKKGDISCQPRRRQALLHWAYDSRKL
jgi:hypothetical protein